MSNIKKVNDLNFESFLSKSSIVILKFGATWCGPCKMIAPILEELADEMSNISFLEVDIDDENSKNLTMNHNVQMVPTIFFYKDKKIVSQISGFKPKDELIKIIESI